ncbi:MAG: hypothetical protein ACFE0R_07225 [Salinarimonas sp.]
MMGTRHPTGTGEYGEHRGGSATNRLLSHLSTRLDGLDAEVRESLLVKAFMLLADAHGDVATAITCLEEAASSGHGAQDDAL